MTEHKSFRPPAHWMPHPAGWRWDLGTRVRKISGSQWEGVIVGFYATDLTPEGYAVESEAHPGSVQIYPAKALEALEDRP